MPTAERGRPNPDSRPVTGSEKSLCSSAFGAVDQGEGGELHGIAKGRSAALIPPPPTMPFDPPNQRLPRYLTQEETRAFFGVIADPRDRALFTVVYLYGLRVAEVGLLVRGDVDLDRGRIVVKRLKGGAWAERPLFSSARDLLAIHVRSLNGAGPTGPLFPGNGGPLRKRQIQSLFTRYRNLAGLPPTSSAHSLRHSIATHMLDAGVSLEFVQDHLGHQNIRSTSIYAKVTSRHREALFQQLEASPWIVRPADPAAPSADHDPQGERTYP